MHGCFASQYGWPTSFWNLPDGHIVHSAALPSFEKVVERHFSHVRSAVALGGDETRSPATQTVCGRQNPFPAAGWNAPLGHGSHAAAFSAAEKCPAAQPVHALPSTAVPGLHVPQYPADAPPQPWRPPAAQTSAAHSMHSERPVAFWKEPVGQLSQTPAPASALDVPTLHATHAVCPSSGWKVPSEHGSHSFAFFEAEKAPAGHG
jgi:hypothetical protein